MSLVRCKTSLPVSILLLLRRTLGLLVLSILLTCLALADSSGWQGTSDASGADMKRTQFLTQTEVPGTEGTVGTGTTMVDASLKAWFDDDHFTLRTQEQIRAKVQEVATDWNVPLQPVSLADYTGFFVEKPVEYSPGAWGGGGFRHAGVGAAGKGYLTNGEYVFTFEYSVGGDGVYTNAHQEIMIAEATAAQQEARSIIMGLKPYRAPQAPEAAPVTIPETEASQSLPTLPDQVPASPPSSDQEIPWATLVGVGGGAILVAAVAAALKKKAPPPSPKSLPVPKSPQSPPVQPPAAYVLQVSTDHLQLSETSPAVLTVSIWKVDPIALTYQPAQDAVIELTSAPQIPQMSLNRQPSTGRVVCQLSLTGPSSIPEAQLKIVARAGGSTHGAEVKITLGPSYRLEFF